MEYQVVILMLVVIVPLAFIWAFKASPKINPTAKKTPITKPQTKSSYVYDQFLSRRFGKRK